MGWILALGVTSAIDVSVTMSQSALVGGEGEGMGAGFGVDHGDVIAHRVGSGENAAKARPTAEAVNDGAVLRPHAPSIRAAAITGGFGSPASAPRLCGSATLGLRP